MALAITADVSTASDVLTDKVFWLGGTLNVQGRLLLDDGTSVQGSGVTFLFRWIADRSVQIELTGVWDTQAEVWRCAAELSRSGPWEVRLQSQSPQRQSDWLELLIAAAPGAGVAPQGSVLVTQNGNVLVLQTGGGVTGSRTSELPVAETPAGVSLPGFDADGNDVQVPFTVLSDGVDAIIAPSVAAVEADRQAVDLAAVQVEQDREAVFTDRQAVSQDRSATAADRVVTGQDRAATSSDRVATGQDRVATGQDKAATAADRAQTGQDRTAVSNTVNGFNNSNLSGLSDKVAATANLQFRAAGTGAATRTVQSKLRDFAFPEDYGAVGDGVTDDSSAFAAAFTALGAGGTILLQNKGYFFLSTLTVPNSRGIAALGGGTNDSSAGRGPRLIFDASVGVCLDLPGSSASGNPPYVLKGFTITRPNGTAIVDGMVGIRWANSQYSIVEGIRVRRQWIGHDFTANHGLHTSFTNMLMGEIGRTYLNFEGGVEYRFTNCRFGINGGGDLNTRELMRLNGGNVDTLSFVNCQVNQAGPQIDRIIFADNWTDADGLVSFVNCHAERFGQFFVRANDVTPTSRGMYHIKLANSSFNCAGESIDLEQIANCDGYILESSIVGCLLRGKWTFSSPDQLAVMGNTFVQGLITFDACKRTTAVGNTHFSAVAISGVMEGFMFASVLNSLTYTDTSTGRRTILPSGASGINAKTVVGSLGTGAIEFNGGENMLLRLLQDTGGTVGLDIKKRVGSVQLSSPGTMQISPAVGSAMRVAEGFVPPAIAFASLPDPTTRLGWMFLLNDRGYRPVTSNGTNWRYADGTTPV